MSIKERVLASMKTSYAKYGFKKDELSQLADIVSANLKDESTDEEITAALTANEGYAKMMQSVYNRGVSETNDKYKDYIPKPKEDPKQTTTTTTTQTQQTSQNQTFTLDDVKKLAQGMVDDALKPYKERDERNRLQSILEGNSKLKGVSKTFIKRYHLDKEEDADKVADEIVNDWTEIKQGLVQDGTFVAAPAKTEQRSNDEDFRKMMEDSAKRVQEKNAETAKAFSNAEPKK